MTFVPFLQTLWELEMFPFLMLKIEVPRASWVNENLSRTIYGNIKELQILGAFK